MKTCPKCKIKKQKEDFTKQKNTRDGLNSWCKSCQGSANRDWYSRNKDRSKAYGEKWRMENLHRWKHNVANANLIRQYNITLADYDRILLGQGSCCAICKSEIQTDLGRFHVDHDHQTGVVRGLLCGNCNRGLGVFQDDPDFLRAAADYLELKRDGR